ncbi:hypothetical protein CGRA01v4_09865 [Colletotrichum graminicola]|nr:hypothetical protein CGRA01v4_09865 [Colletotrichum graminicola]
MPPQHAEEIANKSELNLMARARMSCRYSRLLGPDNWAGW